MKKFGILTLGCRVNHYESQGLSEELEKLGYESAPFSAKCDIYIINSCAVTEESVRKSKQMVRRAAKVNPDAFIAVCGCASQLAPDAFTDIEGISYVCGTRNKSSVIDAIKASLDSKDYEKAIITEPTGPLDKTFITRFDRTRAYVKIQDGCENKCAYCIIPSLRGTVVLRDRDEILREVNALAEGGCHEVVLTGIETSAYGEGLSELIQSISRINGIERIRLGSLEPSFLKAKFIDAVSDIPQLCPHFHISLQSGSDGVLRRMRRRYNTDMIEKNIGYLRSKIKGCNLSADVIVGFPGETDEEFEETCRFVRKIGFSHLHVFTYSKRPGTEAAEMDGQIPESIKTERLHTLSKIAEDHKNALLRRLIDQGEEITVLIETASKGYLTGHTDGFVECLIDTGIKTTKGETVSVIPTDILDGKLKCIIKNNL